MTNELTRINELEQEAMFSEELIAKLQIDAAQVVGKDKLIAEMQKALDEANAHVERLRPLVKKVASVNLPIADEALQLYIETPAQSLREVRAEAVESAARYLVGQSCDKEESFRIRDVNWELHQLAKQLRNGEPK